MRKEYPILEFDPERKALIEPSNHIQPADVGEHCVICFFREVLRKVRQEYTARQIYEFRAECDIEHVYEIEYNGQQLGLIHPMVGAPLAAGVLEEAIALGYRKFVVCGGAGVLDKEVSIGHLIVPVSAVRDEGTSYHYIPPSREVFASPAAVAAIEKTLEEHGVEYIKSKTWTTDAYYRETPSRIKLRKAEGCLTVDMEAAAFFAVAEFRGVQLGQILYGGDDVSGLEHDSRKWSSRKDIRERLFHLAAEACLGM